MRRVLTLAVFTAAFATQVLVAVPADALTVTITEFPIPSGGAAEPIAAGPGGSIWFGQPLDDRIGRINPAGIVTEYPLPSPFQEPRGITRGPDGTVWFTETGGHVGAEGIGRIEPSGTITEFPLPAESRPFGITMGPDGNLWFTLSRFPWRIGRITPAGTVTVSPVVLQNPPLNIVAGPDGNLWFTEDGIVEGGVGAIGRITPSGTVTEFVLPTPVGFSGGASDITVGPDGSLWFTWNEQVATEVGPFTIRIGRITTSGVISSFLVSTDATNRSFGIVTGPDGGLWFTEGWVNRIGRMSTSGSLTEFAVPTTNALPFDIASGRGSTLWYTEAFAGEIGRIRLSP